MSTRLVYILLLFGGLWVIMDDIYGRHYLSQFIGRVLTEPMSSRGAGGYFSTGEGKGAGGGALGGR